MSSQELYKVADFGFIRIEIIYSWISSHICVSLKGEKEGISTST